MDDNQQIVIPMPTYCKPLPSLEYLLQHFSYDPDTGIITYVRGERAGKVAGWVRRDGYITISINNSRFYFHRIAFKIQTGSDPDEAVDHRNGNRADNRWVNLRQATIAENNRNCKIRTNNTSGFKGVSYNAGASKWQSHITYDGKVHHIGLYETAKLASIAYQREAVIRFGEFVRLPVLTAA